MFLQANTVTQISLIVLMSFLLAYLWLTARENRLETGHAIWYFIRGLGAGGGVILASLFGNILESGLGDVIGYIRGGLAVIFYYQIGLFFYALSPAFTRNRREAAIFSRILQVLILGETVYFFYRVVGHWQTGVFLPRPPAGEIPLILLVLWTAGLIVRGLVAAEAVAEVAAEGGAEVSGQGRPTFDLAGRLWLFGRGLVRPRSSLGQIYRWFALTILTLILLVFFFSLLPYRELPLWVDILLDGSLTVGVTVAVFVYLRYQLVPISLEIRVVGVGLTLFLLLVHVLSWGISLVFLAHALPGVPYAHIFGSPQQPDFIVPGPYRDTARQLGDLILVVIWFQIGGSLAYITASVIYYRHTIMDALTELLTGFDQAERGNLAHRIPHLAWPDEFSRIAVAFNHMAETLFRSNQEVERYQEKLEELVEVRTRQLAEEIEQRKALELQQGIQVERNRIAQEAHDGLLQSLSGVRIRLRRGRKLSKRPQSIIETELTDLGDEVARATKELRQLINDLKLDILNQGLKTAIDRIMQRQEQAYRVTIHTRLDFDETILPVATKLTILRLVQEAVSNACKHSKSDQIWVTIMQDSSASRLVSSQASNDGNEEFASFDANGGHLRMPDSALYQISVDGTLAGDGQDRMVGDNLTITIRDEGRGFEPTQDNGGGWGLGNMRQRVEQAGGTFHIHSQLGQGTCVRIALPGNG